MSMIARLGRPVDPPHATERTSPEDPLARSLGWASSGLGVPQTTAPGRFARSIGVGDDVRSRAWTRAVGARELAASAGILSRRRPAAWLWARVAGDAMDMTLLGVALRRKDSKPERIVAAMTAVAGIAAADVAAGLRATRASNGSPSYRPQGRRAASVTIRRPVEEVRRAWHDAGLRKQFLSEGDPSDITCTEAPGDRGTEVRLTMRKGEASPVLRRFKQLVETGVLVRSDGSPDGAVGLRQLKQRPAQPLGARTS